MSILLEAIDPRGIKVKLTEDQWNIHILGEHPYMSAHLQEIRNAIENPFPGFIYSDADFDDRNVYYHWKLSSKVYVKVVVGLVSENSGEIITAFKTDSCKKGEDVIWPRLSA